MDDLKRTAKLRDLGRNSSTEVQLIDALTKRIVAQQKAARCASSSDEHEIENIPPRKVVSYRTLRSYMDKVCPDVVKHAKVSDERRHEATTNPRCSIFFVTCLHAILGMTNFHPELIFNTDCTSRY